MKIYLVGGAVRDELLGVDNQDRDWVVVGATPSQLIAQGYHQVGKDFPIFLHPKTREEYALATGPNQRWNTTVTLEEDLQRRDLSMNAIAKTEHGQYIDPFNGRRDIKLKIIRHINDATFQQDPIRILRVARFTARYHHQGFVVAEETIQLMQRMVKAGQLDQWIAERIWAETNKALLAPNPDQFFLTLRQCHALRKILPAVDKLFGIPQSPNHHPEIDTGIHTMMVLQQACHLSDAGAVRFAALLHDVGKSATSQAYWPQHPGHEIAGETLVEQLCQQIKPPNEYIQLAKMAARYHTDIHRLANLSAEDIIVLLEKLDAFRRPTRFHQLVSVCMADCRGRIGYEQAPYPQTATLKSWLKDLQQIDLKSVVEQSDKFDIQANIRRKRVLHLQHIMARPTQN